MRCSGKPAQFATARPVRSCAASVERIYRSVLILTFGGGTNEVQRDIIAMAGLGMPHYKV